MRRTMPVMYYSTNWLKYALEVRIFSERIIFSWMKKRTTLVNVTSKYRRRLSKTCIPIGSKITNQEIGNNKSYLDFLRHKKYIISDLNIPTQRKLPINIISITCLK